MKIGTDSVLLGAWCPIDNHPYSILDIGAGTGDFLSVAKKDGWQTIGVEPSDRAKAIAKNKGVSFIEQTSELENHSFDVISMWHVLEHVPDLDKQIKELKRVKISNSKITVGSATTYSEFLDILEKQIEYFVKIV